jgi:hypothetical protein
MSKCRGDCGTELPRSKGNRSRIWCDDKACRARWQRATSAKDLAPGRAEVNADPVPERAQGAETGRALDGLRAWLEGRAALPTSLVAAAEALAIQVDLRPDDSQLWGRYQKALDALTRAAVEHDQDQERAYRDLMIEFDMWPKIEGYRRERHKAALDAGDERQARRFEKLVPIGCTRGEHHWQSRLDGAVCLDCDARKAA